MDFLNPLQVDAGHDTDQQVDVFCDIDFIGNHAAVQAFVEHDVGIRRYVFPWRELAGCQTFVSSRFFIAVQVQTFLATAGFAVGFEQFFQFLEQVGFSAKVAEVVIAFSFCFGHGFFHRGTVIAVEAVAFDDDRVDFFADKDVFESVFNGRGACAG